MIRTLTLILTLASTLATAQRCGYQPKCVPGPLPLPCSPSDPNCHPLDFRTLPLLVLRGR